MLELVPVKIYLVADFQSELLPVNLLHLVELDVLSLSGFDQKGNLFLETNLFDNTLAFGNHKLTSLDVIKSLLAKRLFSRLLKLTAVQSVHIQSCVEVLHDILKKQMLALFAVLNVSGALDSQINQRQSFLFAFLVNF